MNTTTIKEQLHNYLEIADDKKLKAIYIMVEDEIRESSVEYTEQYKEELDQRLEHYLDGGEMITSGEMADRLKAKRRKKN